MIDVTSSHVDKEGMKRERRFALLELDIGRNRAAHVSYDLAQEQIKPGVKGSAQKPPAANLHLFNSLGGSLSLLSDQRHTVE
jgi:hypothetical protein